MKVSLITPERRLFLDEEVEYVEIPTQAGYVGILPGHFPTMGNLGIGILQLEGKEKIAVEGGFFRVENDELTILAKLAWRREELNKRELEKEKEESLKILSSSSDPQEVEKAAYSFTRASVFLTLFNA